MAHAFKARIVERRETAPDHVEFILQSPALAEALPGQFCHVLTPGMLRRPISFSRIDRESGTVGLLLQVVGSGTAWLYSRQAGDYLDVLGPLGRGFDPPRPDRPWILIGGGVGIPPIFAALKAWQGAVRAPIRVALGARTADYLIMRQDFHAHGLDPWLATDDGSLGRQGYVVSPLPEWLQEFPQAEVMACGPTPMLAAVSRIAAGRPARVQLALEQRMGCGIGACLACVVEAQPVGPDGPRYRRVCTDGPVFLREELVF
ncbi:dihydroorotate dehydrogenase electron transfer subunit [Sulfobacillus harzensis]|uniref:Dihydroorotate dehydrogenase electron transfer subunit n=1 Tax=Sulfobacillus harzensis TaxID=2729629 RepID=A0A7Y0Q281_9FIRM|nr:dihydroorotate dehydrogenase electron transfer subunit [Sulfobacillus harzensis]NMP21646.1 dihydroorotate dehydrogenase electron transfer subunit [Sulfobacillus harzensis]